MSGIRLASLIASLPPGIAMTQPVQDAEVTGVVHDSRQATPGSLFVAASGGMTDGHDFIPESIASGVAAVIGTASSFARG